MAVLNMKENLLLSKNMLKEELINRIKNGYFENGLFPLLEKVGPLSNEERESIANFWFKTNKRDLINYYLFDILTDNRESIKRTDYFYLKDHISNSNILK